MGTERPGFAGLLAAGPAAYAGIGSRRTPPGVLRVMELLAAGLAWRGWVLRTGLAEGADQAFYRGAGPDGLVEVYLPWPGFNAQARRRGCRETVRDRPAPAAFEVAARAHPAWELVSAGARKLHARNCHQLLGDRLADPARFVLCWTPDGSHDGTSRDAGGTGQALRIAAAWRVPVFNLADPGDTAQIRAAVTAAHPAR